MDKKQLLIRGAFLLAGTGLGFGAGYLTFKKKFEKIAAEEIESVRASYAKAALSKPDISTLTQKFPAPEEEVSTPLHQKIVDQYGSDAEFEDSDAEVFRRTYDRVPTDEELDLMAQGVAVEDLAPLLRGPADSPDDIIIERNVFDTPEPDPEDLGEGTDEEPEDSAVRPFVISAEQWFQNETDYSQITLTYWADDDVLTDDARRVVTDVDNVVGATNLHRFGFKSDDADLVYVRNHRLSADYEITKDERNWGEVVHGVDPEAERSGVPRRMRSNDD